MVWGTFLLQRHFSFRTPPGTGMQNIPLCSIRKRCRQELRIRSRIACGNNSKCFFPTGLHELFADVQMCSFCCSMQCYSAQSPQALHITAAIHWDGDHMGPSPCFRQENQLSQTL